jgi:hypothetical protein
MGGPIGYMSGGPIGYMSGGPIGYATGGDIEAIYDALFGRAPDKDGLEFYTQELAGVPLSVAYDRIAGGAQGADAKVALQKLTKRFCLTRLLKIFIESS